MLNKLIDKILRKLHGWATRKPARRERLIKVYLTIGHFIPAFRVRGDRIIVEAKHENDFTEISSETEQHAVDGISQYDFPLEAEAPLVSVIVPNYNHAPYLRERLDSVYGQTYENFEVILLDDCSSDQSREILEEYRAKYPDKTRTFFNEENVGQVNVQWNKGLSAARGKYVWIAESDDWCELDFLEKLVPELQRQSIMIVFARSVFMQEGKKIWSTEEYLHDIQVIDWTRPFRMTAYDAVRGGFGIRNFIPNVSSAVFRNIGSLPDEVVSLWQRVKLCGDWLFYLYLIKGGAISYVTETTNYYRIHPQSTSLSVQETKEYYLETEIVSKYVAGNYQVEEEIFDRVLSNLKQHYLEHHPLGNPDEVEKWYHVAEIREEMKKRFPNVMVCNFALQSGGGEVFPLHLAMALRKKGIAVTLLDARMDQFNPKVREMLDPSVPLVELVTPISIDAVCHSFGAEIIHSHHASVDKLIALNVNKDDMKQVITLHGMYEAIDPKDLADLLPYVCKRCSCFAYIADKNLQPFRDKGYYDKCRFVKVHNGLVLHVPEPIDRATLNIPEDAFVFCLVSRALFSKGWLEAAEAVKLANKTSEREIHLILVGEGEAYDRLKSESSPFIHAVGMSQNPKAYFATSDMGLLPSYFAGESVPLVIIESLSCSKPVLATNVGQIEDMLMTPDGEMAGEVIPLRQGKADPKELAEKMVKFAQDEEHYQKAVQNTSVAVQRFDIQNVVNEYLEIYASV